MLTFTKMCEVKGGFDIDYRNKYIGLKSGLAYTLRIIRLMSTKKRTDTHPKTSIVCLTKMCKIKGGFDIDYHNEYMGMKFLLIHIQKKTTRKRSFLLSIYSLSLSIIRFNSSKSLRSLAKSSCNSAILHFCFLLVSSLFFSIAISLLSFTLSYFKRSCSIFTT